MALSPSEEQQADFYRNHEALLPRHNSVDSTASMELSSLSVISAAGSEDDEPPHVHQDADEEKEPAIQPRVFFPQQQLQGTAPLLPALHVPIARSASPSLVDSFPPSSPRQVIVVPRNDFEAQVTARRDEILLDSRIQGAVLGNAILLCNALIATSRTPLPEDGSIGDYLLAVFMLLLSSAVCIFLKLMDRHIRWAYINLRLEQLRAMSREQQTLDNKALMWALFHDEIKPRMSSHHPWLYWPWLLLWMWSMAAQPLALGLLFGGVICQLPTFSSVTHCALKSVSPIVLFSVLVLLMFSPCVRRSYQLGSTQHHYNKKTRKAESTSEDYTSVPGDERA